MALEYTTGRHELRLVANPERPIKLGANVVNTYFMPDSTRIIVSYRDGPVYLIDTQLPPLPAQDDTSIAPQQLIDFVCTVPLKSGFWTDQDSADLVATLGNTAPKACQ